MSEEAEVNTGVTLPNQKQTLKLKFTQCCSDHQHWGVRTDRESARGVLV